MKKVFVKTTNYERFQAAVRALETRGAPEAGWLLVSGDPARGKSTIVDEWAAKTDAIYLRGKEQWTPRFFVDELLDKLKLDNSGSTKARFQRLVTKIGREQLPVVIDEVQHALIDGAAVLETLRDITDLTETTVILVAGEENVRTKIARRGAISSRINKVVEFSVNTLEDTALVCQQRAEVGIGNDLVAEIHRQAEGKMRSVCNAIATIEQIAQRNKLQTINLADVHGIELIHDWQSRRQRTTRAPGMR